MQLMQHIIKNTIFSTKTQQNIPFRQSHSIFGIYPDEFECLLCCAAKYRSASAISVYPEVRNKLITALRNAHITCGMMKIKYLIG